VVRGEVASVELRGIRKRYGAVEVVCGLDLSVAQGTVLCLLGGSGCGKTTTLRMIAGLERPDEGSVRIGEALVSGPGVFVPPERRGLGMVFQSYAIWPHLDVFENVAFPLRRAGRPLEPVVPLLEQLGLGGLARRRPDQLSGGQQQRVALARALVADPAVLLLDEPLSNLDTRLRIEVRSQIRELVTARGITAVLVTHDHDEAFAIADQVAFLNAGRPEQVGPGRDLWERPRTAAVARFFGVQELPGERVEGGVRVGSHIVRATPVEDAPAAGPCRLAFRAGDASLGSGSPPGDGGIEGIVERCTFLGDHVSARIRIGEARVDVPGEAAPGEAAQVWVRRAWILPA
jgi:iron(III) transport system ATP-binding protein